VREAEGASRGAQCLEALEALSAAASGRRPGAFVHRALTATLRLLSRGPPSRLVPTLLELLAALVAAAPPGAAAGAAAVLVARAPPDALLPHCRLDVIAGRAAEAAALAVLPSPVPRQGGAAAPEPAALIDTTSHAMAALVSLLMDTAGAHVGLPVAVDRRLDLGGGARDRGAGGVPSGPGGSSGGGGGAGGSDGSSAERHTLLPPLCAAVGTLLLPALFPELPPASMLAFPPPPALLLLHALPRALPGSSPVAVVADPAGTAEVPRRDPQLAVAEWADDVAPLALHALATVTPLALDLPAHSTVLALLTVLLGPRSYEGRPPRPTTVRLATALLGHAVRCLRALSAALACTPPAAVVGGAGSSPGKAAAAGPARAGPGSSAADSAAGGSGVASGAGGDRYPVPIPELPIPPAPPSGSAANAEPAIAPAAPADGVDPGFLAGVSAGPTAHPGELGAAADHYHALAAALQQAYRVWSISLPRSSPTPTPPSGPAPAFVVPDGGATPATAAPAPAAVDAAPSLWVRSMAAAGTFSEGAARASLHAALADAAGVGCWRTDPLSDDPLSRWAGDVLDALAAATFHLAWACAPAPATVPPAPAALAARAAVVAAVPTVTRWIKDSFRFAPASASLASAGVLQLAVSSMTRGLPPLLPPGLGVDPVPAAPGRTERSTSVARSDDLGSGARSRTVSRSSVDSASSSASSSYSGRAGTSTRGAHATPPPPLDDAAATELAFSSPVRTVDEAVRLSAVAVRMASAPPAARAGPSVSAAGSASEESPPPPPLPEVVRPGSGAGGVTPADVPADAVATAADQADRPLPLAVAGPVGPAPTASVVAAVRGRVVVVGGRTVSTGPTPLEAASGSGADGPGGATTPTGAVVEQPHEPPSPERRSLPGSMSPVAAATSTAAARGPSTALESARAVASSSLLAGSASPTATKAATGKRRSASRASLADAPPAAAGAAPAPAPAALQQLTRLGAHFQPLVNAAFRLALPRRDSPSAPAALYLLRVALAHAHINFLTRAQVANLWRLATDVSLPATQCADPARFLPAAAELLLLYALVAPVAGADPLPASPKAGAPAGGRARLPTVGGASAMVMGPEAARERAEAHLPVAPPPTVDTAVAALVRAADAALSRALTAHDASPWLQGRVRALLPVVQLLAVASGGLTGSDVVAAATRRTIVGATLDRLPLYSMKERVLDLCTRLVPLGDVAGLTAVLALWPSSGDDGAPAPRQPLSSLVFDAIASGPNGGHPRPQPPADDPCAVAAWSVLLASAPGDALGPLDALLHRADVAVAAMLPAEQAARLTLLALVAVALSRVVVVAPAPAPAPAEHADSPWDVATAKRLGTWCALAVQMAARAAAVQPSSAAWLLATVDHLLRTMDGSSPSDVYGALVKPVAAALAAVDATVASAAAAAPAAVGVGVWWLRLWQRCGASADHMAAGPWATVLGNAAPPPAWGPLVLAAALRAAWPVVDAATLGTPPTATPAWSAVSERAELAHRWLHTTNASASPARAAARSLYPRNARWADAVARRMHASTGGAAASSSGTAAAGADTGATSSSATLVIPRLTSWASVWPLLAPAWHRELAAPSWPVLAGGPLPNSIQGVRIVFLRPFLHSVLSEGADAVAAVLSAARQPAIAAPGSSSDAAAAAAAWALWTSMVHVLLRLHLSMDREIGGGSGGATAGPAPTTPLAGDDAPADGYGDGLEGVLLAELDRVLSHCEREPALGVGDLGHAVAATAPLLSDHEPLHLLSRVGLARVLALWARWVETAAGATEAPLAPATERAIGRGAAKLAAWWVELTSSPSKLARTLREGERLGSPSLPVAGLPALPGRAAAGAGNSGSGGGGGGDVAAAWQRCEAALLRWLHRHSPPVVQVAMGAPTAGTPPAAALGAWWTGRASLPDVQLASACAGNGSLANALMTASAGGVNGLRLLTLSRASVDLLGYHLCRLHLTDLYVAAATASLREAGAAGGGGGAGGGGLSQATTTAAASEEARLAVASAKVRESLWPPPAEPTAEDDLPAKGDLLQVAGVLAAARQLGWTRSGQLALLAHVARACLWSDAGRDALPTALGPGGRLADALTPSSDWVLLAPSAVRAGGGGGRASVSAGSSARGGGSRPETPGAVGAPWFRRPSAGATAAVLPEDVAAEIVALRATLVPLLQVHRKSADHAAGAP